MKDLIVTVCYNQGIKLSNFYRTDYFNFNGKQLNSVAYLECVPPGTALETPPPSPFTNANYNIHVQRYMNIYINYFRQESKLGTKVKTMI